MVQNSLFDLGITNSEPSQELSGDSALSPQDHQTTRSLLCTAATGLGKTVVMGAMARHWPNGRVMMISHRFELNQQAIKAFESICGEDVGLEQSSYHADQFGESRVVVASVQTLNAKRKGKLRLEKFNPADFGLIMVDEAHRAAAASYRRVFDHFKQNENCRFFGVTATPDRLDGVGLGCVFEDVVCDYNIAWGIENGWLVEPAQKFVRVDGLDLTQVRTRGGDLDEKQLARIVEVEENLHAMAKPIVDLAGRDKQTIVFAASVAQAHRLCELIRDYSHRAFGETASAVSIDGSLSPQDPRRKQIVSDFKAGNIQFLCNCGVATEGFDAPNVRLIAVGRPTKSRALYVQMIGRGTRPLPGTVDGIDEASGRRQAISQSEKPSCTVLDFTGQAGRHSLVCTTDILAGKEPEEVVLKAREVASRGDFDGTTLDAIREARELLEAEKEAKRAKVTVGVDYSVQDANTKYDISMVPRKNANKNLSRYRVSEKQRKYMIRLGFTSRQVDGMNMKQASDAIDYAINNPRNGFARWVKKQREAESNAGE